jgi:hypothetical protein
MKNDTNNFPNQSKLGCEIRSPVIDSRRNQRGALACYVEAVLHYPRLVFSFYRGLIRCCKRDPYRLKKRKTHRVYVRRSSGTRVYAHKDDFVEFLNKEWDALYDD